VATARKALIDMAAQKLNVPAADLTTADGMVRRKAGGTGIKFADFLVGKSFHLKLEPKAPLKDPKDYTIIGKPLPRPDVLLLPGAVR
jgi:nicotinate dehydrogenase subunit B